MGKEPSLTHVCVWLKNSWKAIRAAEAYEMTGQTGVAGHQRMFICNLCGQFVTLVAGNKQAPHFRHLKRDADKSCAERTFTSGKKGYAPSAHNLPLRLVKEPYSGLYRFDLGLIRVPFEEFSGNFGIKILPCNATYSAEHLNLNSITYVSLGYTPYETYQIELKDPPKGLRVIWPEHIPGINPIGTLFNKESGIRLSYDADVRVNEDYILLLSKPLSMELCSSISIERIEHKQASFGQWQMYVVRATSYDELAAEFFIRFSCRLTERPAAIQPIWPLYSEGSYEVRHSSSHLYLLVDGNVSAFKSFPSTDIEIVGQSSDGQDLYKVSCDQRQQLVSTGRSDVLQYTYLWKEPLICHEASTKVNVTDLKDRPLEAGSSPKVPFSGCLRFFSPFDGYIVQRAHGEIINRVQLKAQNYTSIHNIILDSSIEVCIGLDIVWSHEFKREKGAGKSTSALDEDKLLRRLNLLQGMSILAPHTLPNIQARFVAYPKIFKWIGTCIRTGTISARAYRYIEHTYRTILNTSTGD